MSDAGQMMITVQQGTYPDFMYDGDPNTTGYPYRYDPSAAKASSSWANVFSDLRSKFVTNPLVMAKWYAVGKTASFFHWSLAEGDGIFTYPTPISPWRTGRIFIFIICLMQGFYVPLIICGLLGTVVAFLPQTAAFFGGPQTDGLRFVALLHAFTIGVHIIGAPFARYSVPFRPLTFLLAIFFLLWLARSYFAITTRPVMAARG
jgi:hypothetical protein